jgi:hypothetical protein
LSVVTPTLSGDLGAAGQGAQEMSPLQDRALVLGLPAASIEAPERPKPADDESGHEPHRQSGQDGGHDRRLPNR